VVDEAVDRWVGVGERVLESSGVFPREFGRVLAVRKCYGLRFDAGAAATLDGFDGGSPARRVGVEGQDEVPSVARQRFNRHLDLRRRRRATTTGYAYDVLGRSTTVPAAHTTNPAGGNLTVTYHSTDLVRSIVHNGRTTTYTLDVDDERIRSWTDNNGTTTEYGTPRDTTTTGTTTGTKRYDWLGAKQRAADTPSGVTLMGVRLYNPTTGRFLSIDPIPGGNANAYEYCRADPVNCTDLDGKWGWAKKAWKWTKKAAKATGRFAWKYKYDIALTALMFVPGVGAAAVAARVTMTAARAVRAARAVQAASRAYRFARAGREYKDRQERPARTLGQQNRSQIREVPPLPPQRKGCRWPDA
jgi:RHS repeat-associated protein